MPTLIPADMAFLDEAKLRIDTMLSLEHPPQQVWDVLVDNEGWPEWFGSCKAARTTSEPPYGEGTQLTYTFTVNLKPWLRPMTPIFRWKFTRLFKGSLAGLQPHLDRLDL